MSEDHARRPTTTTPVFSSAFPGDLPFRFRPFSCIPLFAVATLSSTLAQLILSVTSVVVAIGMCGSTCLYVDVSLYVRSRMHVSKLVCQYIYSSFIRLCLQSFLPTYQPDNSKACSYLHRVVLASNSIWQSSGLN